MAIDEAHSLSLEDAQAVFDILVEEAGASPGLRDDFVFHQRRGCREFRFQGKLGFGGKFWNWRGVRLHVNCYPEDLTDERAEIIQRTDARLNQLTRASEGREVTGG